MNLLPDALAAIRDFIEAGGGVLYGILFVTALMWTFIFERLWFFFVALPRQVERLRQDWARRGDTSSWYARQIRAELISGLRLECRRHLSLLKSMMVVLPLLGLLGTVTGMIAVFDVMALTGTGNARLMAAGVSRATIPTMAGLVAALSGLYFATWLDRKAELETAGIADVLVCR
ncbi:MAG TPA: MotA/TolQ/ExbB proton channel family protein [Gammaproteobacteria bacterium]|nr:MotA/TolQ/ExbB proton channel family protein [Gammaproteobacteria bacterium]